MIIGIFVLICLASIFVGLTILLSTRDPYELPNPATTLGYFLFVGGCSVLILCAIGGLAS